MNPSSQRPHRGRLAWVVLLLAAWTAPWGLRSLALPQASRCSPGRPRKGVVARPFSTQEAPLTSKEELEEVVAEADAASLSREESLAAVVQGVESMGLFVDIPGGGRGFVPKAMVRSGQLPLAEHFAVGQEVSVRFERDVGKGHPVYGMADLPEEDLGAFLTVPRDRWLLGVVRDVGSYGLHVDVGHESGRRAMGLVHLLEMSGAFVAQEELGKYREGGEVRVRVKAVGEGGLSLSMLDVEQEEVATDLAAFRNVSSDALLTGRVARIFPKGVQVQVVDPPGMGVVATGDIPGYMLPVEEHFKAGQEVSVRVSKVREETGLLDLSVEAKREGAGAFLGVPKDGWLRGFVHDVRSFGLLVDVEHPESGGFARGLVHGSQVPGHMRPLSEHCKEGQEVSVQVVNVDDGQLSLRMVEMERVDAFLTVPGDQWLEAVVRGVSSMGLHVHVTHPESGRSFRSLVHFNRMLQGDFQEGQEVAVRLERVDVTKKRIHLTMKEPLDFAALAKASREAWHSATVQRVLPRRVMLVEAQVAGQSVQGIVPPDLASRSAERGKQVQVRIADVSPEKERVLFTSLHAPREAASEGVAPKVAGTRGLAEDLCQLLQRYGDALSQQGYDSVASLQQLSREEWQEMKQVCDLRPGHAAKLRAALHPEWA